MINFIDYQLFAQTMGQWLDLIGVVIMLIGMTAASIALISRRQHWHQAFVLYRQNLCRSILLGLEFMLAGDIIRTVAGDLTMDSVFVLALIVMIRLVLGTSLQMEIDGRWPWQRPAGKRVRE